MERPNLEEIARRPVRYWNADGVPEMVVGLMWMVWGGAWLVGSALPHDWRWNAYWLVVPPALALSATVVNTLIRHVKKRVTFPRTGYVEWRRPERGSRLFAGAVIVVAALALAVVILTRASANIDRQLPAIMTAVMSITFLSLSVRQRAPHYIAFAAVAIGATLATTSLASGWDSLSWMFVALGCASAVYGGARLAMFVRHNPVASTEDL